MVSALEASSPKSSLDQQHTCPPQPNRRESHHRHHKRAASRPHADANVVLKVMKAKMGASKTFGENIIFILNRLGTFICLEMPFQLLTGPYACYKQAAPKTIFASPC
jgi:hypothetical protein